EIGKGNAVPFLQVAKAARGCDVLKELAFGVSKHAIGDEGSQIGIACPQIEIQEAVVVQVAEVTAHGVKKMIQAHGFGDVREGAVTIVVVKARSLGLVRQSKIVRGDVAYAFEIIPGNEQVRPTIIVVVEKPSRKALDRFGNVRGHADVDKLPVRFDR